MYISRPPNPPVDNDFKPLDIEVRTYAVAVINSNEFEPQDFASYSLEENSITNEVKPQTQGVNINLEQDLNKYIKKLKHRIKTGSVSVKERNKYVLLEDILYYLSNPDDEPTVRLHVPNHLRTTVSL